MKNKQSGLSVLLGYAGSHKKLTILGCTLSGISAVLTLLPFICIWFVIREIFRNLSDISQATGLSFYGWLAFCLPWEDRHLFCRLNVYPSGSIPHRPQYA